MDTIVTAVAIVLGIAFFIDSQRRRVRPSQSQGVVRTTVRARPTVQTRAVAVRPRRVARPSLPSELARSLAACLSAIEAMQADLHAGWQRGRTPRVMSHSVVPIAENRPPGPSETLRNAAETAEMAETPRPLDDKQIEQVQMALLAKLLTAKVITSETRALETTFDVKAGGGKEYQALRSQLKTALAERTSASAETTTPLIDTTSQQVKTA
jgi:hypothetical protein